MHAARYYQQLLLGILAIDSIMASIAAVRRATKDDLVPFFARGVEVNNLLFGPCRNALLLCWKTRKLTVAARTDIETVVVAVTGEHAVADASCRISLLLTHVC